MVLDEDLSLNTDSYVPPPPPIPSIKPSAPKSSSNLHLFDSSPYTHLKDKSLSIYDVETHQLKQDSVSWVHQLPFEWIHNNTFYHTSSLPLRSPSAASSSHASRHLRRRSSLKQSDRPDPNSPNSLNSLGSPSSQGSPQLGVIGSIDENAVSSGSNVNSSYLKRHTFKYRNREDSNASDEANPADVDRAKSVELMDRDAKDSNNSKDSKDGKDGKDGGKKRKRLFGGKRRSYTAFDTKGADAKDAKDAKDGKGDTKDAKKDGKDGGKRRGRGRKKNTISVETVPEDKDVAENNEVHGPNGTKTPKRRNSISASTRSVSMADSDDSEDDDGVIGVNLSLTDDPQTSTNTTESNLTSAVMSHLSGYGLVSSKARELLGVASPPLTSTAPATTSSSRALKHKFKQKIKEIDSTMKNSKNSQNPKLSSSNSQTSSNTPSNASNTLNNNAPNSKLAPPVTSSRSVPATSAETDVSNDANASNAANSDKEALKKSLEHVVIGQPKSVRRKGSVLQRLYSRVTSWTDKNRNAFLSYQTLLKKCVSEQEELITKYQSELHSCKKTMSLEIKKWKRWAQTEAENMARTYYENKYMLLSTQIEIAMARLQSLESMFNKVTFVLDGGSLESVKNEILIPFLGSNDAFTSSPSLSHISESNPLKDEAPVFPSDALMPDLADMLDNSGNSSNSSKNYDFVNVPPNSPENVRNAEASQNSSKGPKTPKHASIDENGDKLLVYSFRDPDALPLGQEMEQLESSLPTLVEVEQQLREQYNKMQEKVGKKQNNLQRGLTYRKLLQNAFSEQYTIRSQGYHYHPMREKTSQFDFNCLLIDDRYPEGKLLRAWRKQLSKKYAKFVENSDYNEMFQLGIKANEIVKSLHEMTSLIMKEYPISDAALGKYLENKETGVTGYLQTLSSNLGALPGLAGIKNKGSQKSLKGIDLIRSQGELGELEMTYEEYYLTLKLFLERLVYPRLLFSNDKSRRRKKKEKDDKKDKKDKKDAAATPNSNSVGSSALGNKITIWELFYNAKERENDVLFVRNCVRMRQLTQEQLSIPERYAKVLASFRDVLPKDQFVEQEDAIALARIKKARSAREQLVYEQFNSKLATKNGIVHSKLPYYECILSFYKSRKTFIPNDMLYFWLDGLRSVNADAQQYCDKYHELMNEVDVLEGVEKEAGQEKEREMVQLAADDLFPILVWVMVHSRLEDVHLRIGFIDKFLDDNVKFFGEVGMCLSLVQAAAEFVTKWEPLQFDKIKIGNK